MRLWLEMVLYLRNGAASGDLDLVRGDGRVWVYTEVDVLTFAATMG